MWSIWWWVVAGEPEVFTVVDLVVVVVVR